jgi:NAD(P)H dehydrogenase (quinone)
MLHAVIVAHPKSDSLGAEIARTYIKTVESFGHETDLRDLYRMGFDPCLKADEMPSENGFSARSDVVLERARLDVADVIVFVYPLWFNGPPAILKGYVERVFGMGFGYSAGFGGTRPQLGSKRFASITTSGAPEDWFRKTGAMDALLTLVDLHLCEVTGMTYVDHMHLGAVTPGLRADVVADLKDAVTRRASRWFGPVGAERLRTAP